MAYPPVDPVMADLFDCFHGVRELAHRVLAPHDLTMPHLITLRKLQRMGHCSMKRLNDAMHFSPGGGTAIVDRLSQAGLVARAHSPGDRRKVEVSLTPEGEAFYDQLVAGLQGEFMGIQERLEASSWEIVAQGLETLAGAFRTTATQRQGEMNECQR